LPELAWADKNLLWDGLAAADSQLLAKLREARLTPLIYAQLLQRNQHLQLPPAFLQEFQLDYAWALKTATLQEQEALQVFRGFNEAGVAFILLKGADLRLRIYQDPAQRPMGDLDLLISRESLETVRDVLEGLAYSLTLDSINRRQGFRERYRMYLNFQSPQPVSLRLDLHWGLEAIAGFYRLPFMRVAQQAQILEWEGMPVRVLSPEHALLHLCLHHYDEGIDTLRLVDLSLALTLLPLNWHLFLAEAIQCGAQAPVSLMLRRLAELIPGTVPPQVLRELEAYVPRTLERLILRFNQHPLAYLVGILANQRCPLDWVGYLAALLWPDTAYLTAISGSPSRLSYLVSSLQYLFSRRS
jgi:hypothetical protein